MTRGSFLPPGWDVLSPQLDQLLDAEPTRRAQLLIEITGEDADRRIALEQLLAECERGMTLLDDTASERFADLARDDDDSSGIALPAVLGDRYRLGPQIGQGGMAKVFLAEDLRHGRSVAVKVIRPELIASVGRGRFLREIELVARLRHPNIMPLFDSGEADGVLYYVMPHETGASLKGRLADGPPISLGEGIAILRDVARALAHAHGEGVVHRDIKPANVMLSGGAAVVADFGIGKAMSVVHDAQVDGHVTSTGAVVGTAAYMAPEQAAGNPDLDHRADLYSFGCLAHAVLVGTPPFAGAPHEILASHLGTMAPSLSSRRPGIPEPIARIVDRCLRKTPADRPASASELLSVLEGPLAAPTPRARVKPRALVGVGAALMVAAIAWLVMQGGGAPGSTSAGMLPVAILPFGNPGANPAIDYIATALPSHVADRLGVAPDVLPFDASRDLIALPDSARRTSLGAVGIRSIIDGDISVVDDSVVADVEVLDPASGAKRFVVRAGAPAPQFAALVNLVADSLRAHLGLRTQPAAAQHVPNPEALRLVSEADHLFRLESTDPGAADRYRRASEVDPRWYRPFIGLSDFAGIALSGGAGTRSDANRAAAAARFADDALRRAGASGAAQAAALIRRALPRYLLGEVDASRVDAQLAASLDSTDAQTQRLIGAWWRWNGDLDSAWKYKARAHRLAPWNPAELAGLASLVRCARDSAADLELLTRAIAIQPQRPYLIYMSEALAKAGRWDEAHATWRRANPPEYVRAMMRGARPVAGEAGWRELRTREARHQLEQLRARAVPRRQAMQWIEAFEGTGQRDSAVAVLGEWIASGAPKLSFQRFCLYSLDGFRRDARVQALVRGSRWPLAEFDTARTWQLQVTEP